MKGLLIPLLAICLLACTTSMYSSGEKDPAKERNAAMAYFKSGNAYMAKGQNDRAIEEFNKSISLNPSFAMAYSGRVMAWRRR